MTVYKAPEQEFQFLLKQFIDYDQHCKMPGFEDASSEMVDAILPEAAKFFEEVIAPTNKPADQQGTQLRDGKVYPPQALEGCYQQLCEAGWPSLSISAEHGGSGFPGVVGLTTMEMLQSSNLGFSLLPLLTQGVIHALALYGSKEQQQTYLGNLTSGHWSGTMNLTEPQAGSDLGLIKTRAVPQGDHYLISGQKIFITWGDQEYSDNIIHLVLARTPDAPEGTQGISMFIVPKYMINEDGSRGARNDVQTVAVEHKLGIHSSPTCVLQYGENGGAVGYLVGRENQGLIYMFAMMNQARLAVGHQGVSVSERAYQHALAYARDRLQGASPSSKKAVPIIEHPDVRRMLMLMRSLTEGARALSFYAIGCEDRALHHSDEQQRKFNSLMVDVLTPLVKAWCTESSMEVTSLGVQIHGGMGFIEETGAAQFMRDARILPIYEGTNGIQALDLIGRKCLRDGGTGIGQLLEQLQALNAKSAEIDELKQLHAQTGDALQQAQEALQWVLQHPQDATAIAHNFLTLLSNSAVAALLTHSATLSHSLLGSGENEQFHRNKIATAKFFAAQVLPRNLGCMAAMKDGSQSIMGISGNNF